MISRHLRIMFLFCNGNFKKGPTCQTKESRTCPLHWGDSLQEELLSSCHRGRKTASTTWISCLIIWVPQAVQTELRPIRIPHKLHTKNPPQQLQSTNTLSLSLSLSTVRDLSLFFCSCQIPWFAINEASFLASTLSRTAPLLDSMEIESGGRGASIQIEQAESSSRNARDRDGWTSRALAPFSYLQF